MFELKPFIRIALALIASLTSMSAFSSSSELATAPESILISPIQLSVEGPLARFEIPIPSNGLKAPALSIRVRTEFRALRDNQEIAAFGNVLAPKNERGSVRHVISLRNPISDQSIFIEAANAASENWIEGPVLLAEEAMLFKNSLRQDIWRLAFGLGFFFLGTFALLIYLRYPSFKELLLFGSFTLLASLWTISFCARVTLAAFPFNIDLFWGPAVYWTTYLAMPILLYLSRLIIGEHRFHLSNSVLYWGFSVFAFLSISASLAGLSTLRSFNFAYNCLLVVSIPFILVSHLHALRNGSRDSLPFVAGVLGMIVLWLLDSLSYVGILAQDSENPSGHLGIVLLIAGLAIALGKRLNRLWHDYQLTQKRLGESEKAAAISRLTQMLAHDVRRPFSMLRTLLSILKSADTADVEPLIARFTPEVEKSVRDVDGLIADVMETGSITPPRLQDYDLEALIVETISNVANYESVKDVHFDYALNHTRRVMVDRRKILRVFTNIVSNALEATPPEGRIWFKSHEAANVMHITIGNSGSHIDQATASRIFDDFFTSGKVNGTGLGLAIAKKIVKEHGGSIRCQSSLVDGTEFIFTLPLSPETSTVPKAPLPASSKQLQSQVRQFRRKSPATCAKV